ncbi:MAG TPA: tRNA (adenosine(37)-N6)-threonylcarbamoyltransferase complex ATPase subunit type 1 TsaE [Daejeonella sp.]|nr:tRNA (adenosine(37)-N6)-threonylcarbamoyltransferase complex ATPase subunit type 1 TsaE [Daejeonella sp.]
MLIEINSKSDLPAAAKKLLFFADSPKVFLFFGEMGAGKTTFIQALCAELGVTDLVASPTFSIVNEYKSRQGVIYHFDFYRIKNEEEAFDIGFEEYLYSGNYCFIEWPEKITSLWPPNYVKVNVMAISDTQRVVSAETIK